MVTTKPFVQQCMGDPEVCFFNPAERFRQVEEPAGGCEFEHTDGAGKPDVSLGRRSSATLLIDQQQICIQLSDQTDGCKFTGVQRGIGSTTTGVRSISHGGA